MIEALYVHIPFCEVKCNYCDFLSFSSCTDEMKKRYVKSLEKEALLQKEKLGDIKLKTIFFGGGTPTCLSGGFLKHLTTFLLDVFEHYPEMEISIEANPGTVDREKLFLLKKAGINRISFGVQSFNETLLQSLGRIHSPQDVREGFYLAREAGFTNINLDLMYGLPTQTLKQWENTLKNVLELNPEHISTYQLKIEEGTPLGKKLAQGKFSEFDDELALEMYQLAIYYLNRAGLIHYEVSNFAKPGFECSHNCAYWLTDPYLGLGVGAHSYLSPRRFFNLGNLKEYLNSLEKGKLPPREEEILSLETAMSEAMFMGLRMLKGVNLNKFETRFGLKATQVFNKAIKKCLSLGLIELSEQYLKLTEKGLYLGNLVFEEFLLTK